MQLIETFRAHQLFKLLAEGGGVVSGGVVRTRGRLGGPLGFAVRHGRDEVVVTGGRH